MKQCSGYNFNISNDGFLEQGVPGMNLGNALGWFYGFRAVAQAFGIGYKTKAGGPFFKHLPLQSEKVGCIQPEELGRLCHFHLNGYYPHLTPWIFDSVLDQIDQELRYVIDKYLEEHPPSQDVPWTKGNRYAIIQERCVIRSEPNKPYGPNSFSIALRIPVGIDHIYVLHPAANQVPGNHDPHNACEPLADEWVQYVKRHRPQAQVSALTLPSTEESFITMAKADVLVREASSSYSLFAALANPRGSIISSVDFTFPSIEPAFHRRPNWILSSSPPLTDLTAGNGGKSKDSILSWAEQH